MFAPMVVCVLISRFRLIGAIGSREALLREPVALAPEPGGLQRVGEASASAEAFGVRAGMGVGEALVRCPALRLVPPDPHGVRGLWAFVLGRLERIGARVESDRPGVAYFDADGLRRLHGGATRDVVRAADRALRGSRFAGVRLGAGPSRFVAYAAAVRARPRHRAEIVEAAGTPAYLARLPAALLRTRPELGDLPDVLERLGIHTLGELAALPAPAVAERFGRPGLLALDLALGRDTPLEPRRPPEPVAEEVSLPDATSGQQLERALQLLVVRALARPERRGRTVRSLALFARFVEEGTWRTRATLREPTADAERIRLALSPHLQELPAPAESLGIEVEAFGPPAHDQPRLTRDDPAAARHARLSRAVAHVRGAAGESAALRVMEVDPRSRVPERRAVLAPYPAEGET